MNYALFSGCTIPHHLPAYEESTKALLKTLGIKTRALPFSCCGNSVRDMDTDAAIFMAARNLALAEAQGVSILTPCKCCFGSLKTASSTLAQEPHLAKRINRILSEDGLAFTGRTQVIHLLSLLAEDVGFARLTEMRKQTFTGLAAASSYGCHALRPSSILQFDSPHMPTIFESLVSVTGAASVQWNERLQCCGSTVKKRNPQLARALIQKKVSGAMAAGADIITTACPHCQRQYNEVNAPSVLFPQLLGLSLGIDPLELGFQKDDAAFRQLTRHMDGVSLTTV